MRLGHRPKRTDQIAVRHAARTCRLTCQAPQATIDVWLRAFPREISLQHLFHKNDPPARRIHLLAEFSVRWAGRQAEAAMDAGLHGVRHRFPERAQFLSW